MPRIPLEDNFTDVLGKAQRGQHLTDAQLADKAGVPPKEIAALKSGEIKEFALRAVARALKLGPNALVGLARQEWYPEQPLFPRGFAMFNTVYEDMTVNSYLVWDPRTRLAAAFDTGADASGLLDVVSASGLSLRYLFITHAHEDHIADLDRLAGTGAEIWISEKEPFNHPQAKRFKENAHFHLGEIAIKTLLTWGHSPRSLPARWVAARPTTPTNTATIGG